MCNCITDLSPLNIIVVIVGDFNLSSIDWSADNCLKCSDVSCTGVFLNFYNNLGLTQFVSKPTNDKSILDLVLSIDPNCIGDLHVCIPFGTSDHSTAKFYILSSSPPTFITDLNFYYQNHADWDSIMSCLDNIHFTSVLSCDLPTEFIFAKFNSILYD